MGAAGADASKIWQETGWDLGTDGHWRYEISDHNAHMIAPVKGGRRRLRPVQPADSRSPADFGEEGEVGAPSRRGRFLRSRGGYANYSERTGITGALFSLACSRTKNARWLKS
jgi:hypothetical protein